MTRKPRVCRLWAQKLETVLPIHPKNPEINQGMQIPIYNRLRIIHSTAFCCCPGRGGKKGTRKHYCFIRLFGDLVCGCPCVCCGYVLNRVVYCYRGGVSAMYNSAAYNRRQCDAECNRTYLFGIHSLLVRSGVKFNSAIWAPNRLTCRM